MNNCVFSYRQEISTRSSIKFGVIIEHILNMAGVNRISIYVKSNVKSYILTDKIKMVIIPRAI